MLPSPPPPPPPYPPLRLPPFPALPATGARASTVLRIVGLGATDFGDTQRYQTVRALSSVLGVGLGAITLGFPEQDAVLAPPQPPALIAFPAPLPPPPARRALRQAAGTVAAVRLALIVSTETGAQAAAIGAALAAAAADGSLLSALRAAGLAGARSAGVLVGVTVVAPPPPPLPPPPAPVPVPEPDWLTKVRRSHFMRSPPLSHGTRTI